MPDFCVQISWAIIQALKDYISKELSQQHGKKVVVVIDDIDRLHRDEMLQLFRVIKAVANFPNVVYVLAFDKEVVRIALSSKEGWDGASWLEKIVQVSFDVPLPGEQKISGLFTHKLNELIKDVPDDQINQFRWERLYNEGIKHFLRTPRHVVRLINALSLTLPPLIQEVDISDFVALETLRLFCPHAYNTVRRDKNYFITTVQGWGEGKTAEERKNKFHQTWLAEVENQDREAIGKIIQMLFPEAMNGSGYFPLIVGITRLTRCCKTFHTLAWPIMRK